MSLTTLFRTFRSKKSTDLPASSSNRLIFGNIHLWLCRGVDRCSGSLEKPKTELGVISQLFSPAPPVGCGFPTATGRQPRSTSEVPLNSLAPFHARRHCEQPTPHSTEYWCQSNPSKTVDSSREQIAQAPISNTCPLQVHRMSFPACAPAGRTTMVHHRLNQKGQSLNQECYVFVSLCFCNHWSMPDPSDRALHCQFLYVAIRL